MFLHEFREDFVLALELLLQVGDPLVLGVGGASGAGLEGGGAVLEELLLPAVEHGGVDAVLVTQIRDGDVFEEMQPSARAPMGPAAADDPAVAAWRVGDPSRPPATTVVSPRVAQEPEVRGVPLVVRGGIRRPPDGPLQVVRTPLIAFIKTLLI